MFRYRFWILLGTVSVVLGGLLGTAGYGLYLRSNMFADAIARRASAFLGAPVQIGSVVPLDATSQCFRDVVIWLPDEHYPIFYCEQATARLAAGRTLELELRDGEIVAETDTWNQATLATLLKTTFAHDFQQVRLTSVTLVNMDITVQRGGSRMQLRQANGRIDLSQKGGRADLLCQTFNDVGGAGPIGVRCRFQHGSTPLVEELSLTVDRLPLQALLPLKQKPGQHGAPESRSTGTATSPARTAGWQSAPPQPSAGTITGTIIYRQSDRGRIAGPIEFHGEVDTADLAVLARFLHKNCLGTMVSGVISGAVSKAVIEGGRLQSLYGRVRAENLQLAPLLVRLGYPESTGLLTGDVHELRYEDGQVKTLLVAGNVSALQVEPMLRSWCGGTITGVLQADIEKIKIIDGRLDELAGVVRMAPPPEGGTIDRAVLESGIREWLHVELPPVLPETIGYTNLGVRLHGADDQLYVEGIAGPDDKYLLMADFSSITIPLIAQPVEPLSLEPLQALIATRLRAMHTAMKGWGKAKG